MAYKTFVAGDVLTAAQVNDNLMDQVIPIFADATARDAAITSPIEGQFAYLSDNNWLTWYDGSSWIMNQAAVNYTGTTDTLALTDAERTLYYSNASQVTVTVPTNASVAFPVGTRIVVYSTGAGGITLTTTSLTILGTNVTCAQYEAMYLEKYATDSWIVIGGTS